MLKDLTERICGGPSVTNSIPEPGGELLVALNQSGAKRWTTRIKVPAVIVSERESRGINLIGVEPDAEADISGIPAQISSGRFLESNQDQGLVIGAKLAQRLETRLGKRVVVMSQDPDNNISERGFRIVGIYRAKMPGLEEFNVYAARDTLQELLKIEGRVSQIIIVDENYRDIDRLYLEEMMKRFVHELRYSRKITHRNVIRIYDFLHLQGCYAISMEFFPSHTLSGEIPDAKPMDLKKALGFSRDMATGMTVAHQAGVIHRDLKPANILVNDEGLLKIVDFGVAAAASSGDTQLTKTGYVIGSPKYMAPEQILGKKVDQTADVYSIGVIMYEMCTGVPPYSRGDHMSVMYQHVQGKAMDCQEINKDLPDDFAALIVKAMSVDKTKRYQSMEELTDALDTIRL